jgi:hypothetical protein
MGGNATQAKRKATQALTVEHVSKRQSIVEQEAGSWLTYLSNHSCHRLG